MRNGKRILQLCSIALLALSICSSCLNKSSDTSLDKSYGKSDSTEIYHTIVSDDSLVTAIWHDTGEGGTAPDIDCVVKFKSEDGKLHEEHRPLLQLAHPNDDYSHHEVQKIVSLMSVSAPSSPQFLRIIFFCRLVVFFFTNLLQNSFAHPPYGIRGKLEATRLVELMAGT